MKLLVKALATHLFIGKNCWVNTASDVTSYVFHSVQKTLDISHYDYFNNKSCCGRVGPPSMDPNCSSSRAL